jgi:short-subunit dehydrogenase
MHRSGAKLEDQVVVLTGASSGIGLVTARQAAERGAHLVLCSRDDDALQQLAQEINDNGGTAVAASADVADQQALRAVADAAIKEFGRIDTWINNAGVSIYGLIEDVPVEDAQRMFETNYWGVVNGSLAALPYLKGNGGALINVGSILSDTVVPLQGHYAASKHAVKGFTDALRIELERIDQAPVSVTLIQPTAVDTPFDEHARNYMDKEANLPTPQLDPQDVADAILEAAVKPTRDLRVGMMSKVNTFAAKNLPGVADRMAAKQVENLQRDEPPRAPDGTLYHPGESGHVHGDHAQAT